MNKIEIDVGDSDIESTHVYLYDDEMFINQIERGTQKNHCVLLTKDGATQLRDALDKFLRGND